MRSKCGGCGLSVVSSADGRQWYHVFPGGVLDDYTDHRARPGDKILHGRHQYDEFCVGCQRGVPAGGEVEHEWLPPLIET